MKFAKVLQETAQTFQEPLLSQACIPYKQWKKTIKYAKHPWTLADLEKQCERIETIFCQSNRPKKSTEVSWRNPCFFCWKIFHGSKIKPDPLPQLPLSKELLTFAEINTLAVMKLCKKLEKTATLQKAQATFNEWRRTRRFQFMGSDLTTRLRLITEMPNLNLHEDLYSCPICFEMYGSGEGHEALLNPCGHSQCYTCFIQMTKVESIRATLENRLAIGSLRFQCPICRYSIRKRPLKVTAFWPNIPIEPPLK
jgi:hypothetical protein